MSDPVTRPRLADPGDGSSARAWTLPENWDASGNEYIGPGLPPWGTKPRCPVARNGRRCRKACIPGGTVCNTHGGAAPQVKRRAQLRLLSLVDPALSTLARTLATTTDEKLKTQIAFGILDRTGLGKAADVSADVAKAVLMERYYAMRAQHEADAAAATAGALEVPWAESEDVVDADEISDPLPPAEPTGEVA